MSLIISIDGGGSRGVIACKLLKQIFDYCNISIDDISMLAGTSTGSIIATMLASGYSIDDITNLYFEHSAKIFSDKRILPLFEEKYDDKHLIEVLQQYIGERTGADLSTKVIIPLTDLTHQTLEVYKSWKSSHFLYDVALWKIIRAATAAPVFFEPYYIRGICYCDGGIIANDPTVIAYAEWNSHKSIKDIGVFVSVGTGRAKKKIECKDAQSWGAIQWLPHLINLFVNADYEFNLMKRFASLSCFYFRVNVEIEDDVKLDITDKDELKRLYDKADIPEYKLKAIKSAIELMRYAEE